MPPAAALLRRPASSSWKAADRNSRSTDARKASRLPGAAWAEPGRTSMMPPEARSMDRAWPPRVWAQSTSPVKAAHAGGAGSLQGRQPRRGGNPASARLQASSPGAQRRSTDRDPEASVSRSSQGLQSAGGTGFAMGRTRPCPTAPRAQSKPCTCPLAKAPPPATETTRRPVSRSRSARGRGSSSPSGAGPSRRGGGAGRSSTGRKGRMPDFRASCTMSAPLRKPASKSLPPEAGGRAERTCSGQGLGRAQAQSRIRQAAKRRTGPTAAGTAW